MRKISLKPEWAWALCLCLALAAIPHAVFAQTAGGGAFLNGATTWMQTAAITGLSTLAVIVLGILLMAMRFSLVHAAMICAGIWVAFNATYLSGLLHA